MPKCCAASSFCISSPPCQILAYPQHVFSVRGRYRRSCLYSDLASQVAVAYVHRLRRLVLTLACALCMIAVVDKSTMSSVWRAVCTCLGGTSQCH